MKIKLDIFLTFLFIKFSVNKQQNIK